MTKNTCGKILMLNKDLASWSKELADKKALEKAKQQQNTSALAGKTE